MQKKVILAVVILILVYLSYKLVLKIQSGISSSIKQNKDKADLEELLNTHTTDVGGSQINKVKTFAQAEYNLMADSLFTAMDGLGTSKNTIFAIISRLRTKADWFALVGAYGTRKASFGSFKGSLSLWLSDELGGTDKVRINNILGKFNVQI